MVERRSPKPRVGGSSPSCPATKGNIKMDKFLKYFEEAKIEIQKVIFPTKDQVKNAYIAVFVVVLIVSLFLGLIDLTMSFTLSHIM